MTYFLGLDAIASLIGNMVVGVFGSPMFAGLFLFGFVAFVLVKLGVSFDVMLVIFGLTIATLFATGLEVGNLLFFPMIIVMLGIVGFAIVKIMGR